MRERENNEKKLDERIIIIIIIRINWMNINLDEEKERMNQCLYKNKWNDVDGDDGECDIEL